MLAFHPVASFLGGVSLIVGAVGLLMGEAGPELSMVCLLLLFFAAVLDRLLVPRGVMPPDADPFVHTVRLKLASRTLCYSDQVAPSHWSRIEECPEFVDVIISGYAYRTDSTSVEWVESLRMLGTSTCRAKPAESFHVAVDTCYLIVVDSSFVQDPDSRNCIWPAADKTIAGCAFGTFGPLADGAAGVVIATGGGDGLFEISVVQDNERWSLECDFLEYPFPKATLPVEEHQGDTVHDGRPPRSP